MASNTHDLTRLMIIGCPGSGKTKLSNRLGHLLDRQVYHLDKLLWQANWVLPEYQQRKAIHDQLIEQDSWIIDGMWNSHLVDRLSRATCVIMLDYNRLTCMLGIVKRYFRYRRVSRDDMAQGCKDRLDREFVKYTWTFRKKKKQIIMTKIDNSDVPLVHIRSRRQLDKFVDSLS